MLPFSRRHPNVQISQDGGQLLHRDRGPRERRTPTVSPPRTRYGPDSRRFSPAVAPNRWRTPPGTGASGTSALLNRRDRVRPKVYPLYEGRWARVVRRCQEVTRRCQVTRRVRRCQFTQRFLVPQLRFRRSHPWTVGRVASVPKGSCAAERDSLAKAAMERWVETTCTFVSQRSMVSLKIRVNVHPFNIF